MVIDVTVTNTIVPIHIPHYRIYNSRASFDKGNITMEDLLMSFPFRFCNCSWKKKSIWQFSKTFHCQQEHLWHCVNSRSHSEKGRPLSQNHMIYNLLVEILKCGLSYVDKYIIILRKSLYKTGFWAQCGKYGARGEEWGRTLPSSWMSPFFSSIHTKLRRS